MSDVPIKTLNGVNGQVEMYPTKLVIKRKGMLSKMTQGFFKGDKTIYIKQITGVQIKPGTLLTNGYIQFTIAGGIESTAGIMGAGRDENAVMIKKKDNELAREIQAHIEQQQQSGGTTSSAADELKKMKGLLDDGVLTKEEFEVKKKQLLGL